jgi:hypothetical protein
MRKLKLEIDSLQVESFDLVAENGVSTIHAYVLAGGDPVAATDSPSCPTNGCGTCYESCWRTCKYTCEGETGETESDWMSCEPCWVG